METKLNPQGSEQLYRQADGFADNAQVFHGFFGRQGGVSTGIYASLNCGAGSNDDPDLVEANRTIVAKAVGTTSEKLLSLYQVHGTRCLKITEAFTDRPEADAFVTDVPGLALGILTADCTPILFAGHNEKGPVIGAAHAGWKGATGGVLEATIKTMGEYGVPPANIRAAIGPCIAKRSYEVSGEFFNNFVKESEENEGFFSSASKKEHYLFDLPGFCAGRLHKAGLKTVILTDLDTYAREDEYFSYRRKTHHEEADYGRQISVIMIR